MSFETRNGKGRYYTRSEKVDGRVKRYYIGQGPLAEIAAAAYADQRVKRRASAKATRAAREELEAAQHALDQFNKLTGLLTRALLLAAGFYRHGGEWRRRRHVQENRS